MRRLLGPRPLLLCAGAALAVHVVGTLTAGLRHPATGTYEDLLIALAAWVLLAGSVWAALIGAAALVETITSGRVQALSWVATPPAVRRALVTSLGLALAGGLPGPVSADVRRHALPETHRPPALVLPLPVPDRLPDRLPGRLHAVPRQRSATVTVRPGDTLWALARASLPAGADDARVLTAVRLWHTRNRAVIGADPDLILPGQRLAAPGEAGR